MVRPVVVGNHPVERYAVSAGAEAVAELRELAAPLRGVRVLHLNATANGGGVAEILRSEVPALRDLGLAADWQVLDGERQFFAATKALHNGLQGAARRLTADECRIYLDRCAANAQQLAGDYDLIVVHDPQPLPVLHLRGKGRARWVWRCHIETSRPFPETWAFLKPFLHGYDAAVFTLGSFIPDDLPEMKVAIILPAIDPESPKNLDLRPELACRALQWAGLDTDRPLALQLSRFDPWKDPLGVLAAYRLAREEVPGLQLVLSGTMADDDPQGWEIFAQVQAASADDRDVHLLTNRDGMGDLEANAFQRGSDVVIQKSLREGFGLVVSEALWKGRPVVAGQAGGIPLQLCDGAGGYLVESAEECAERLVWLLQHAEEAQELARRGQDLVRRRFLLTRLIADELRLYADLLGLAVPESAGAQAALPSDRSRDPICGMRIASPEDATAIGGDGSRFCSKTCRALYAARGRDGAGATAAD